MKTDASNATIQRWIFLPRALAILGGLGVVAAALADPRQLGYSYLLAFMFFLSLGLGGLFLVIVHHLFDASWSAPIRRVAEHLACLVVPLAVLFLPLAFLAPRIYPWMDPAYDSPMLQAKAGYLNPTFFYLRAVVFFAIWIFLAWRLRYWSLQQDADGAASHTYRLRQLAAVGVFLLAITLTFAAVDWMKSLQYQWFSTMYGVYFFAGSAWVTVATVYAIAVWLERAGPLRGLIQPRQLHDLGELLFAFTVFSAYIHFSQYLIIWNGNLPEETFWYAWREKGYWWGVGLVLVFGHFLLPFLLLLRIDFKLKLGLILPVCAWTWLMHFVDLSFNVLPPLHALEFPWTWVDLAAWAFVGGLAGWVFLRGLARHAIYPVNDPRLKEALTLHEVPPPAIAEAVHSRS